MPVRFYKMVTIAEGDGGWLVHLDGKPVKTPKGTVLSAPYKDVAEAMMREWAAQEKDIQPDTMPMTQIVATALDYISHNRMDVEREVLAYLDTDLVFYRTSEPEVLAQKQKDIWDKWVVWFEGVSGAKMAVTEDLHALKQDRGAHDYLMRRVQGLDVWALTGLYLATGITGSVILALALYDGAIDQDDVFQAAQVEEIYRAALYLPDVYGPDPDIEKKQKSIKKDLGAIGFLFRATKN